MALVILDPKYRYPRQPSCKARIESSQKIWSHRATRIRRCISVFAQFHARFAENKNSPRSTVVFIFPGLSGAPVTPGSCKHGESVAKGWALIFVSEGSLVRSIPVFHADVYVYVYDSPARELIVQKHNSEKLFCLDGTESFPSRDILRVYFMKENFQLFIYNTTSNHISKSSYNLCNSIKVK